MALPVGWPPRPASGRRNIRFYISVTTTANFADNAYLFSQETGANTFVPTPNVPPGAIDTVVHYGNYLAGGSPMGGGTMPDQPTVSNMIWAVGIRVTNTGSNDAQLSFDGTNVQGYVVSGQSATYLWRHEAGIAVNWPSGGAATTLQIEAW